MATAVRLDDGGLYGMQTDHDADRCAHRLLITLGCIRVDARGHPWSLDSPDTQLNGPVMDASAST